MVSLADPIEYDGSCHGYYFEEGRFIERPETFQQREPSLEMDYQDANPEQIADFEAKRK